MNQETPFSPAPGATDPRRGKEVWAPAGDAPFEAPAKDFVPGPYYVGVEERLPELAERPEAEAKTKGEGTKTPVDRRDFMKLFSASTVAATAACVQRPVEKAIPYVNQPVDQFPGEAVNYATTCGECAEGCGVMVKTREGRPVKLEGLPAHPINEGRLCAVGQSSLQGLYHPERRANPAIRLGARMHDASWTDVFDHLGQKLKATPKIGILTGASTGHRHGFFREFLEKVGSSGQRLYTIDSNSLPESIVAAHKLAFGVNAMPRADLSRARLIVGVGADFLDVGHALVYNTRTYTQSHAFASGTKGRHVQFESAFTLTGARADERFVIPPGSDTLVTLLLVRALLENKGSKGSSGSRSQIQQTLDQKNELIQSGYDRVGITREAFDKLAADMIATSSVVMAGGSHTFDENATNLQLAAIMANELLGAYDNVLQLSKGYLTAPVQVGDLTRFMNEAQDLDVLFVVDVNPTFTVPGAFGVEGVLKKIPTIVSIQDFPNEVDQLATYALPAHHYLESWGDEQAVAGLWSMRQPAVRPTTNSRQTEEIFMWLAATMQKPMGYENYRAYLKNKWIAVQQLTGTQGDPNLFFDMVVRQGFAGQLGTQSVAGLSSALAASFKYVDAQRGGLRLTCPLDFRLRDGKHAHKPVLQEAADTMTTVTWDTWVALNPTTAQKLGFKKFDVIKVEGPGGSFEASLYPLPGLHPDAVVVPRGNGHAKGTGTIEGGNGVDPLVALNKAQDLITGAPVTAGQQVKLTATGAVFQMAQLQKHNDIANRKDIVKTISLAKASANATKTKNLDDVPNIFPELPKTHYKWGMSIDLTRCTGCQACNVACATENNVPQVGREQVLFGRYMHWIKIDRYFSGPTDSPEVTLQPMLCQHCQHAPCEAVCPVFATTHEPEGINAMTYNRCIGTRYCANACPYKIRRFNWWTHRWNQMGARGQDRNPRAMNPDVTVRTRGVMEKCTFCYQRVRDAKHRAKVNGIPVGKPGNILKTACQQTCPADAITFGDTQDPNTDASMLRRDNRAYLALGGAPEHGEYGLKTLPSVSYLAKVTLAETAESEEGHHGGAEGEHHGG